MHETQPTVWMSNEELKAVAQVVAEELRAVGDNLPAAAEVRARFITVRAALFQRGIFDPVLVRFDTASAPQASTNEIAEQLAAVAAALA